MEEIVISATSCSETNSILVWDLLTGRVLHSFENNVSQPAGTMAFLMSALVILCTDRDIHDIGSIQAILC